MDTKPFLILDSDFSAGDLDGFTVWRWNGNGPGRELAEEVAKRLLPLRTELNAWTVDTAKTRMDGKSVEAWFKAGETLSMWWCATLTEKHPKITHGLFEVFKARALEMVLDEAGAREVRLVSADKTLIHVIRQLCWATGRTFVHVAPVVEKATERTNLLSRDGLKRLYGMLPAAVQAAVRLPVWLWQQKRLLAHTQLPRPTAEHQGTMVSYFPNIDLHKAKSGTFRSRYWESLHDALAENGPAPVNWLFLFFPSNQCSLKEAVAMCDAFAANGQDGLSFHFLEEFIGVGAVARAVRRFFRIRRAASRMESRLRHRFVFRDSRCNFWPLLQDNWKDSFLGWRCLERCLTFEAMRGYAAWAGKQNFTAYVQENCPWERMLCQAMHEAGNTHVYGMQHSTVRPADLRYFDDPRLFEDQEIVASMPDLFLHNGTGAQRGLVEAGMPAERSVMVEALRYQYLAAPKIQQDTAATSRADRPRLLICTSFFADETEAHLRSLADAHTAGVLAGYDLCLKAHPYLPVEKRLAELFPNGGAPELLNRPIGELLTPGTIVWASNSTTVALEAAYSGLPVLVQAPSNDLNLSPVQDLAVPFVRTPEDVAEALKSAVPPAIPDNYLCLDAPLPRWRKLLGLTR